MTLLVQSCTKASIKSALKCHSRLMHTLSNKVLQKKPTKKAKPLLILQLSFCFETFWKPERQTFPGGPPRLDRYLIENLWDACISLHCCEESAGVWPHTHTCVYTACNKGAGAVVAWICHSPSRTTGEEKTSAQSLKYWALAAAVRAACLWLL